MPSKVKCKKCNHPCHCIDDLHSDEYGLCTCKECKCGKKQQKKNDDFWKVMSSRFDK